MIKITKKDLEAMIKEMEELKVDELGIDVCDTYIDFDAWRDWERNDFIKTILTLDK